MPLKIGHYRCSTCPGPPYPPMIHGTGPFPSEVLFLGAGGGKHEARTLRAYSGPAGEEFDHTYLARAEMPRGSVRVDNCVQCFGGGDKISPQHLLDCAKTHLPALLDRVKPEVIVTMGDLPLSLCDRPIRLKMRHGRPQWGSILGGLWEGWIWPSYEPAFGMRETSRMTDLLRDFTNLGGWLRGEWVPPVPSGEGERRNYERAVTPAQVTAHLRQYALAAPVGYDPGADTEGHGPDPWSFQVSFVPHTGLIVLAEDTEAMEELARFLWQYDREVVLHHAGQDLDRAAKMGVRLPRYRDTMQEAFRLCSLPQGLKDLAYQLFGVEMRTWEDVVRPASVRAIEGWMREAKRLAEENLTGLEVTEYKVPHCSDCGHRHKEGVCRKPECGCETGWANGRETYRKCEVTQSPVTSILSHVLRYTEGTKDAEEPYDPWEALKRMRREGLRGKVAEECEWEYLEGELGPAPILGIGNCQLDEAIEYAVSDSDHTGQVAAELKARRQGKEWEIAEGDEDK